MVLISIGIGVTTGTITLGMAVIFQAMLNLGGLALGATAQVLTIAGNLIQESQRCFSQATTQSL